MLRILAAGAAFLALSTAGWNAASAAPPHLSAAGGSATALVVSRAQVIVMVAPNGRDVIVALDGDEQGVADGSSDRVFLLQRNAAVDASLARPRVLENAVLQYDQKRLHVIHESFSGSFSMQEPDGPQERFSTEAPRALGELQVAVLGYGLQRSPGRWTMSDAALAEAANQGFGCGGGSGSFIALAGQDCASGGAGATQCSLEIGGGCSVSCASGYYACCNLMGGCKCRVSQT
jgi:hypothetical protein